MLSNTELKRYSRHLIMPEIGRAGQEKLKQARVLCIGAGGLGSPLALYLAAAGVGHLGLVDADVVDLSNLQRQILHRSEDVGRSKVQSAKEKLLALNPDIEIELHGSMITPDNALELLSAYDIIADGSDNFATRYLVNDACVLLGKPNVHASIFRFEGQASVFDATRGPCYRCLYGTPPEAGEVPNCAEGGVLGVLPGLMGVVQATEVIKLIIGLGEPLIGRMLSYDALQMRTREFQLLRDPDCPACGARRSIRDLSAHREAAASCALAAVPEITAQDLQQWLERSDYAGGTPLLLDVREQAEWDSCRIDGARHIPLAQLPERLGELDPASDIVVYCLMGARSRRAVAQLRDAGFKTVRSLNGGIRAWADVVDMAMPI